MPLNDLPPNTSNFRADTESFGVTDEGRFARRTYDEANTGSLLQGIEFDAVSVAYPNTTTEIYSYFTGGLAGTLVATITVIYTSGSKQEIVSAVRT